MAERCQLVIAGVSEASTKAATLATSVGSFFSAKRSQLFSPPARSNSDPSTGEQELKTPPLKQGEFAATPADKPDSFPPPQAVQMTPAPSTFASFFRSPAVTTPTQEAVPSSSFPGFFRRVSGSTDTKQDAAKHGLKELSLQSSPVFGATTSSSPRVSPKLSPKHSKSPRPSSTTSSASTQSSLSKDYEEVRLP
jgi:hypothetical protein